MTIILHSEENRMKEFGRFDDGRKEFAIDDPATPQPWINYIGNTRLTAFISQQAGGLAWHIEPQTRRLTRYYWLPLPQDRPGFYVYVKNNKTGSVWNPHFAPTCKALEKYECRHGLGYTRIAGELDDIKVEVTYFIPPDEDVMVWSVTAENKSSREASLTLTSYVEFGLLDFQRENFWCYLKNHIGFTYEPKSSWIKYDYHVFEAPFTPAIFFTSSQKPTGFDCSRNAFCGKNGNLDMPESVSSGKMKSSELPSGGHGCGALSIDMKIPAGTKKETAYFLGVADNWGKAAALRKKITGRGYVAEAFSSLQKTWGRKIGTFQVSSGDAHMDRMVNIWNPLNCQVTLERTRDISTDHLGFDGMRFRDTMQDALAVTSFDAKFAAERIKLVLSYQHSDGSGNFSFYPYSAEKKVNVHPERCDNTVWPIFTIDNLIKETGDLSFMDETVPYRDKGEATVYGHILNGLKYIWNRRGKTGLPSLYDADWNDGLAVFRDPKAESVMLGMQLLHAVKMFREYSLKKGRKSDAEWCRKAADEMNSILNSDKVWDGKWYRRLLLSNGMKLGSSSRKQGKIYLEPQVWAVISGAGDFKGRGKIAMDSVRKYLNTANGLMIHSPPYTGIPNPEDPPIGNAPGTGENGAIFCHAVCWAVIAECILGRGDYAYEYYRKNLPAFMAEKLGQEFWEREPYVFTSTIVGPAAGKSFGKPGISWLTGTASWMYIAATQYILGVKPDFDGLAIRPCLPKSIKNAAVTRIFRGKKYDIDLHSKHI